MQWGNPPYNGLDDQEDSPELRGAQGYAALLRGVLGDTPSSDQDSIDTTYNPIEDMIPSAKILAMGKAALLGAKAAGPMTMAGMKVLPEFNIYRKMMAGENPLEHSRESLGKLVQSLGPDIDLKKLELIGAQAADQTGSESLFDLINLRSKESNIVPPKVLLSDSIPESYAAYSPHENRIYLNDDLDEMLGGSQNPDLAELGLIGHEMQHAKDYSTGFLGTPSQLRLPSTKTNDLLQRSGFISPSSLETVLQQAQNNPSLYKYFPSYVRSFQNENPVEVAKYIQNDPEVRSALGNIVRMSEGNAGFRGTSPSLMDLISSKGHFGNEIKGDLDIPVWNMMTQNVKQGGEAGDWAEEFPKAYAQAKKEYQATLVRRPSPPQIPTESSPETDSRIPAIAAGATLGTLMLSKGDKKKENK